jgi:hypothetical protein
LNLLPIEIVQEPALPGPELTADSLRDILQGLEGCGTDSAELQWVNASETARQRETFKALFRAYADP